MESGVASWEHDVHGESCLITTAFLLEAELVSVGIAEMRADATQTGAECCQAFRLKGSTAASMRLAL